MYKCYIFHLCIYNGNVKEELERGRYDVKEDVILLADKTIIREIIVRRLVFYIHDSSTK